MAKKEAQTLDELFENKIELTLEELKECDRLFSEAGGWIKYFSKRNPPIIKVNQHNQITVLRYDNVIGKKVAEFPRFTYRSDIPYDTWAMIRDQWQNWNGRKDYRERKEVEHLEELAKTIGSYDEGNPEF